jgi:hypothetical protein
MNKIGTMSENTIGYVNAVNEVEKILINSGCTGNVSDVVRHAIAGMIWSFMAMRGTRTIYQKDLDEAIQEIQSQLRNLSLT